MPASERLRFLLLRCYALSVVTATILLAPLYVRDLEQRRVHPIDLAGAAARPDGSLSARQTVVRAIRFDGGPWQPAAGVAASRRVRNLPPGTGIEYRIESKGVSEVVSGVVRTELRGGGEVLSRATFLVIALAFCFGAAALAIAGADLSALFAGGAMAGFAGLMGRYFLESTAVRIDNVALRDVVIAGFVALPSLLAFALLGGFLSRFPSRLRLTRLERILLVATAVAALAGSALTTLHQIPGLVDRLPLRSQLALLAPSRGSMIQFAAYLPGALLCILLARRQWKLLRGTELSRERLRRGRFAAVTILVGISPMIAVVALQSAGYLVARRPLLPQGILTLAFLPMVFVPAGIGYAILGRRVDSFGLLVRRAALFAVASRSIRVLSLLPALGVAVVVFEHRDEPMSALFRAHPVAAGFSLAAMYAGLRYGDRFHALLERVFFRERASSRSILKSLAEKTRGLTDDAALSALVCAEIDRAFHLESVTFLLADGRAERFATRDGTVVVPATSALIALAGGSEGVFDLRDDAAILLYSEEEADWLTERRVQLLLPLRRSDGGLLGVLALGEKQSELPFDAEDREMLQAVAAAAAMAIENYILRSSPSAPRFADSASDPGELARYCSSCHTVFPTDTALCVFCGTSLTPSDIPAVVNNKYRIEERLGAGGMGVVYRARDLALGRTVALKTLPSVSAHAAARLRREARTVASLAHEHIAVIFAAESWRGRPILVFEFLPGGTLDRRLGLAPLGIAHVVELAMAVGSALAVAHAAGVLHRDVKPSNIGFDAAGRARLLDFGLAQFLDRARAVPLVENGVKDRVSGADPGSGLVGTTSYLSPELLLGTPPSAAADLWSLGVTLYESLTVTNPFKESNPTRIMNRILTADPPDPRTLRPDCPPALAQLLLRMLAKDAKERLPDAAAVVAAFERLRGDAKAQW